ncbi:hypothetical protein DFQ15_10286 [Xylophilus ampelinus]|uniref:Uncharacterized protein n=2 Tax=Xylophilus ampelinus TaxID=54067 RepID=A0A318SKA6_9BURK|nr:hypothetical protein DFQ15_10286 [Xylophilus ampelinus]
MGAIQSIAPNEVSPASFEQVLELATLLGESIRRNLSQPKGKLYEELLVFAEQCSQVEDRHAIGLAIYAFIAAREGNKKA